MNNTKWVLSSMMESINPTPKYSIHKQRMNRKKEFTNIELFEVEKNSQITESEREHILNNLMHFPYRGALTYIANKRGVTRNTIFASLKYYNNLDYLYIIKQYGERKRLEAGMVK